MKNTQSKEKTVKRGLVASLLTASLVVSNFLPHAHAAAPTETNDIIVSPIDKQSEDIIKGQYLILFKNGLTVQEMNEEVGKYKGEIVKEDYEGNILTVSLTDTNYNKIIQESQLISIIEPNLVFKEQGVTYQYSHELGNVQSAWSNNYTGQGIDIAVIDSGISTTNNDIKISGGISFVDYTSSYHDDRGHGTHVAGIIGSLKNDIGTVGVAYDANLYAVKVLNKDGRGDLSDIIKGVRWAIQKDVDIINISIGTDQDSQTFRKVLAEAEEKGILVVASSGNENKNTIRYPASYDNVIAVGAIDENKNLADFSNFGTGLNIVAPGVNITSTYNNSYAIGEGTSMAAPFVTGLLALYKNAYPELSANEIEQLLYLNAEDLGPTGYDTSFGHGLARFSETTELPILENLEPTNDNTTLSIGVSFNKETRQLEWNDQEGFRYQVAVKEVNNGELQLLGQTTTIKPNYDLNRFKLEDNKEYEITITPRIGTEYEPSLAKSISLTTMNGDYVIQKSNRTTDETKPTTDFLESLPNGITIHTKNGELSWHIDDAYRYQIVIEANDDTMQATVIQPNHNVSRINENTEYIVTITPRIGASYEPTLALKANLFYQDGKYQLAEYVEPVIETPIEPVLPTNPITSLQNGISVHTDTGELTWTNNLANRYQISLTAFDDTKQATLIQPTYNVSRLRLNENTEYVVTIIPRIGFSYDAAFTLKAKLLYQDGKYQLTEYVEPLI